MIVASAIFCSGSSAFSLSFLNTFPVKTRSAASNEGSYARDISKVAVPPGLYSITVPFPVIFEP